VRVLVIGGGAIGQVFGYHFQRGGAELSFLVRPRQADDARAGFALYPLNRGASVRRTPERLAGFGVHTDLDAALDEAWDVIAVCITSVAIRAEGWFDRLVARRGNATLLLFLAGPDDEAFVRARGVEPVWGMLSVITYQAPLPGESLPEPGVAFWVTPTGIAFSGPAAARGQIEATLQKGGLRTSTVDHAPTATAFAGAVLDKTILALQCARWSFADLRRDPDLLDLAVQAMRESWALAEARRDVKRPFGLRLLRPFALRFVLRFSSWVLPLDLEAFFKFHYTKVAEQTRQGVATQLELLTAAGIDHPASAELARRLPKIPPP